MFTLPVQHIPGRFFPPLLFFSSFVYIGKAWTGPGRGAVRQPAGWRQAPQHPTARQPRKARMSRLSSSELFPPLPLQHRSVFIRWDWCPHWGHRGGGASAAVSVPGGCHRLPGCFSICFWLVNSCVLRFVLTQLTWPHARCRARRYFKRRLLFLCRPWLSCTAWGCPVPGAKCSPSNLEGS